VSARYRHDCERCEFLGRVADLDIYRCRQQTRGSPSMPTLVARWGDTGPDYFSGSEAMFGHLATVLLQPLRDEP
jgi:hypothetical protein